VKTAIFDIDGTLADVSHRLHYIAGAKKDWHAFFAAAGEDRCYEPIRELLIALSSQYTIILVSGRPDTIRHVTEAWLATYAIPYSQLLMRKDGDHRGEALVKSEMLDDILRRGYEIAFVVEDHPRAVEMWRRRGLTCLQCRDWEGRARPGKAWLTLMVGPAGAGKSTWLKSPQAAAYGIHPSHILSSDQFRQDLCGDFRDQSRNGAVFSALQAIARERLRHGLPTVIDATNLWREDRLARVALNAGGPVRYVVVNRPMAEKQRDAGWRGELSFDLLARHEDLFRSQEQDILAGDYQANVSVVDTRKT
jgi:hypothetical protein